MLDAKRVFAEITSHADCAVDANFKREPFSFPRNPRHP